MPPHKPNIGPPLRGYGIVDDTGLSGRLRREYGQMLRLLQQEDRDRHARQIIERYFALEEEASSKSLEELFGVTRQAISAIRKGVNGISYDNYNILIDTYGRGLRPPSRDERETICMVRVVGAFRSETDETALHFKLDHEVYAVMSELDIDEWTDVLFYSDDVEERRQLVERCWAELSGFGYGSDDRVKQIDGPQALLRAAREWKWYLNECEDTIFVRLSEASHSPSQGVLS